MCFLLHKKRPAGLKYEKAKEWRIPCVNAQWLGDILLGNFEALRQVQYSRYTAFNLADPFAPTPQLVFSLLGEWTLVLCVLLQEMAGALPHLFLTLTASLGLSALVSSRRVSWVPPHSVFLLPTLCPESFVGLIVLFAFLKWTFRDGRNSQKPFQSCLLSQLSFTQSAASP